MAIEWWYFVIGVWAGMSVMSVAFVWAWLMGRIYLED